MSKTSSQYLSEAEGYLKKANDLISAKEKLSSEVTKVVEHFNNIGTKIGTINTTLLETDDSLLNTTILKKNEKINDSIDSTIEKISNEELKAIAKIDKKIEYYKTLEQIARENYNKETAEEKNG